MREHKAIPSQQLVESKVVCNKCGMTYDEETSEFGYEEWQWDTIHAFKVEFGYGSGHDMERWSFDLCEDCLEEFFATFKIKPYVISTDPLENQL